MISPFENIAPELCQNILKEQREQHVRWYLASAHVIKRTSSQPMNGSSFRNIDNSYILKRASVFKHI
jgi:hypothetical protein